MSLSLQQNNEGPGGPLPGAAMTIPLGRERSLYRDAARSFFANRLAIVGLVIVLVLLALALFADDALIAIPLGRKPQPLLAHTAYDKIFYGPAPRAHSPAPNIGWAPTSMDAICTAASSSVHESPFRSACWHS